MLTLSHSGPALLAVMWPPSMQLERSRRQRGHAAGRAWLPDVPPHPDSALPPPVMAAQRCKSASVCLRPYQSKRHGVLALPFQSSEDISDAFAIQEMPALQLPDFAAPPPA